MPSELVIGAFLLIGPVILVGSIFIGIFGYNPEKAQAIRAAEATLPVVIEEIRHIHIGRPESFHRERLDRHPAYLCLHAAIWCYAWSIFAGAPLPSNLDILSTTTKYLMASCFIIGSTLVLTGSAMGARIGRWRILKGVHDNLTSSRLGDDIRLPYSFAGVGMFAVSVAMGIYASTSFGSTAGSLAGWISAWAVAMCIWLLNLFYLRVQIYERARTITIDTAVQNLEERGNHVDE